MVIAGSTTRPGSASSEEPTTATGEPLATQPVRYRCLRSQIEKGWLLTPFLTQPDTWGDVEISGLHTLEFKSRGVSQQVPVGLILFGHGLLSHDPFADVLRGDAVKWFYCEEPGSTAALADEYPEWQWIQAHDGWLREKYAGLWIAVLRNAPLAVAESEIGVLKQAAERGYKNTFTYYVPTESESPVVVVAA